MTRRKKNENKENNKERRIQDNKNERREGRRVPSQSGISLTINRERVKEHCKMYNCFWEDEWVFTEGKCSDDRVHNNTSEKRKIWHNIRRHTTASFLSTFSIRLKSASIWYCRVGINNSCKV